MKKNTRSKAFTRPGESGVKSQVSTIHDSRFAIAFTLIELLTVIAIIAILAGLLVPTIKSTMQKAETAKAKTAIVGLSTAFRAYYTEYGKWPVADTYAVNSNLTYCVDTNLVILLRGVNNAGSATIVSTSTLQGNPRGITFLEFKAQDLNASGDFVDPWKQRYYCRFDISYANAVQTPFMLPDAPGDIVYQGFLIWSAGPDGQYDTFGDVPPSALNKDNVKSW
jgi:prepilin-type N-terminal cleavage/methylation domain-containing protein